MKLREELILVPVAVILMSLLSKSLQCDIDVRDLLPIRGTGAAEAYLIVLGLGIVGVLLVIKNLRKP